VPVPGHVKTSGFRAAAALAACTLFACVAPVAGAIERESQPPLVPRELDSLAHFPGTLLKLQPGPRAEAVRRIRAAGGERVSHALRLWHLPSARARGILPALAVSARSTTSSPTVLSRRPRSRSQVIRSPPGRCGSGRSAVTASSRPARALR